MFKKFGLKKGLLLLGLIAGVVFVGLPNANASDGAGFSIKAVRPKNQVDKGVSYFDLKARPGSRQALKLKITNTNTESKTLSVSANDAFTNQNGVIEYSSRNAPTTGTAKYRFSELMSDSQMVRLAGKQTKIVKFKLRIPNDGFKGSILGGFYVKPTTNDKQESKSGLKINNQFAMLVGVHLHGQGTVKQQFKLNSVKPTRQNDQAVIKANFENLVPKVVNQLKLHARVTKQGSSKTVLKYTQKSAQMAPNTRFNWTIPVDKTLEAGNYTLHLTATRKNKRWQFTRNFKVADTMTKFNAQVANRQTSNQVPWYYALIGGALVLVIAALAFTLGRRRRQ